MVPWPEATELRIESSIALSERPRYRVQYRVPLLEALFQALQSHPSGDGAKSIYFEPAS